MITGLFEIRVQRFIPIQNMDSAETVGIHPSLAEQSPDIAQRVNETLEVRGNADQRST